MAKLVKQPWIQENTTILCQKPGTMPWGVFPPAGFFCLVWIGGTSARMSSGTLLGVMPGYSLGPIWLPLAIWWGPCGHLVAPVGPLRVPWVTLIWCPPDFFIMGTHLPITSTMFLTLLFEIQPTPPPIPQWGQPCHGATCITVALQKTVRMIHLAWKIIC